MRISDWSSDVCSSDLAAIPRVAPRNVLGPGLWRFLEEEPNSAFAEAHKGIYASLRVDRRALELGNVLLVTSSAPNESKSVFRSEEHTSELQSLMRISYAVFCLKKKT